MKGNQNIITTLNKVLSVELTSINQYFLHARMYKNWGLEALNKATYKKSIKDMKQSDDLIERILFLEGLPNLQHLEKIRIGENTPEMLNCDLTLQIDQIGILKDAITLCENEGDYVSREILADILEYEEEHADWIETQQHLIENVGIENYLQSHIES